MRHRLAVAVLVGVALLVPSSPASAGPAVPDEASDDAQALVLAKRGNKPVEVLSRRDETTRVFVKPDGAVAVEQYVVPQRVRAGAGWVAPDATLRRNSDGSITPVAAVGGLRFSPGGTGPLVAGSRDGKGFEVRWPDALPAPSLSGDTASYAEVLPGVDLRVRAEVDGFSQWLVIKDQEAATNPALARLQLATSGFPAGTGASAWTMINQSCPNQQYWDYDRGEGAKSGYWGSTGTCNGGGWVRYRSLFQFSTANWRGGNVVISKAIFSTNVKHVAYCGHAVSLHVSSQTLSRGTTWNSNAGSWGGAIASNPGTSCGAGARYEFGDLTGTVQASTAWNSLTLGLRAVNEASESGWKKFDPATAFLYVELNHYPNQPSGLSTNERPCGTKVYVGPGDGARLRTTVSDPDGGVLTGTFEWWEADANATPTVRVAGTETAGIQSGGQAQVLLTEGLLRKDDTVVGTGDWDRNGFSDVIARRSTGDLILSPGNGKKLETGRRIGTGWNGSTFAGVADWNGDGALDIVVRADNNGDLRLYLGDGKGGFQTIGGSAYKVIGTSWNGLTFAGIADWDGDTHNDILARDDSNGKLRLYPGDGSLGFEPIPAPGWIEIGAGWSGGIFLGAIDWDRDTNADILVQTPWNGDLRLYLGDGHGGFDNVGPTGWVRMGSGWSSDYAALVIPDFNRDGTHDIVARQISTQRATLYPGSGSRTEWGGQQWEIGRYGDIVDSGNYVWRAGTRDSAGLTATVTGWCPFEVDLIRPDKQPTVVSTDYPDDGAGHGKVGQDGTATLDAAGVADVVGFKYGADDQTGQYVAADRPGGSATVTVTPVRQGLNNLFVRSVDRAGNRSDARIYTYLAGSELTMPVAHWRMEEHGGTSLTDSVGGHTATLSGGATVGGGTATFNGTAAYAATSGPVVDTGKSFSVAAWVRMTDANTWHGVLAQDGNAGSGFYLQHVKDKGWGFCRGKDQYPDPGVCAHAQDPPTVGVWTHLMGVYDAGAQQVRLYVNGKLTGFAAYTDAWNATGPLQFGRYKFSDYRSYFPGDIDDVRVWNRVAGDLDLEYILHRVNVANPALAWRLDEGSGTVAHDSSAYGRNGTLTGGATWGPGRNVDDPGDSGLRLNGTSAHVATASPVLRTDRSFTVSAWAKLTSTDDWASVISQEGAVASGMVLQYAKDSGKWALAAQRGDQTDTQAVRAVSTDPPRLNTWTHLAGVYDAAAGTITLYVNGHKQGSADVRISWNATGRLLIGAERYNATLISHFPGDIDDVRVWPGVLTDSEILGVAQ